MSCCRTSTRCRTLLAVLVAALLALGLAALPPVASAAVQRPAVVTSGKHFGVSFGDALAAESAVQIGASLDDVVQLGATWIRADLAWSDVQAGGPESYDWTSWDRIVHDARQRGLHILATLAYTPEWARATECPTDKCPPIDPTRFARFAGLAAARYGPLGVSHWEIWNEPNNAQFWYPASNVAAYVRLLRLTSQAIRAVQPSATIMNGGLAPEPNAGGNQSSLDFFAQLASLGGLNAINVVADHPYSYPAMPATKEDWNAWYQIDGSSPSIESILKAHGASSKRIWITEYGAPTGGPGAEATTDAPDYQEQPDHVSNQLQAEMAAQSVQLTLADAHVAALFWFNDRDAGNDPSVQADWFGLSGTSLRDHKPAWFTLQRALDTKG